MSLIRSIDRLFHIKHSLPIAPAHRFRPAARSDGFDAAPAMNRVDLGKAPPASRASDGEFVTGLYRDLLGRAPDAGGFAAHMKGLETGMTRDEIRTVFLTSPELRAKQAPRVSEAAPAPMSIHIAEAFPQFPNIDRHSPVDQLRK